MLFQLYKALEGRLSWLASGKPAGASEHGPKRPQSQPSKEAIDNTKGRVDFAVKRQRLGLALTEAPAVSSRSNKTTPTRSAEYERIKKQRQRELKCAAGLSCRGRPYTTLGNAERHGRGEHAVQLVSGLFRTLKHVPPLLSPWFGERIPFARTAVVPGYLMRQLLAVEAEVRVLQPPKKCAELCKSGNGTGLQLGLSVNTGPHIHEHPGCKFCVQVGTAIAGHPELRARLWGLIRRICETEFGARQWYQLLMQRLGMLGPGRLIPGTPFSGIWLSYSTRGGNVHVDHNARGMNLTISTADVDGGELMVCHPKSTFPTHHHIKAGEMVYGTWAQAAHCNSRLSAKATKARATFTCYLDYQVLHAETAVHSAKGLVV